MKITREMLDDAARENIITEKQADRLHEYLTGLPAAGPTFDFTHVLYYLGGIIAIGAMTLFMNLGWESFGGWGVFFISLAYAGIGLKLIGRFQGKGYAVPAGICATFVVALTPLAIYGLQQAVGFWPDESAYREYHRYVKWHWLYMELGTLVAGLVMAWHYRYPFLMMPVAVTLWYMSMDVAVMLMEGQYDWQFRALVSMYFGLLMTLVAFWVDFRSGTRADHAFWLYIFGVMTFWGGMTGQESGSEISKLIYFGINLFMIAIGVVIVRRVFVVFGAIGASLYLGHLAWDVFRDSWLFPIALTAIGLLIIYLGVLWQSNEKGITEKARALMPGPLREFLESRAR